MFIQNILVGIAVIFAVYMLTKPLWIKPKKDAKCISDGKGCGC